MKRDRQAASAIVLAGGRSNRFGADKMGAELGGRALLAHAIEVVADVCREVVVVTGHRAAPAGRAGETRATLPAETAATLPAGTAATLPEGILVVTDPEPYPGPLAALLQGARAAAQQRLLVVAGDMPSLQPGVLARLLWWPERLEGACLERPPASAQPHAEPSRPDPSEGPAERIDGEPVSATGPVVLPVALQRDAVVQRAAMLLGNGSRSLRSLLAALDLDLVPHREWRHLDPGALSLYDVDTREDLHALQRDGPRAAGSAPGTTGWTPYTALAGHPLALAVLARVCAVVDEAGAPTIRATRGHVAVRRSRGFAFIWLPGRYLVRPGAEVVLSIALGRRLTSPRIKEVAHPAARQWMHHLEIHSLADVDDEVAAWLREASARAT